MERLVRADEADFILLMTSLEERVGTGAKPNEIEYHRTCPHDCCELVFVLDALGVNKDLLVSRRFAERRLGLGRGGNGEREGSTGDCGQCADEFHLQLFEGAGAHDGVRITLPNWSDGSALRYMTRPVKTRPHRPLFFRFIPALSSGMKGRGFISRRWA